MGRAATFYSWMTATLGPLVMLRLRGRKMSALESAKHGPERNGYASIDRPKGPLLWFHAVSLGEGMEALPVIKKCLQTRPHVNILMTTSTITALAVQFSKGIFLEECCASLRQWTLRLPWRGF